MAKRRRRQSDIRWRRQKEQQEREAAQAQAEQQAALVELAWWAAFLNDAAIPATVRSNALEINGTRYLAISGGSDEVSRWSKGSEPPLNFGIHEAVERLLLTARQPQLR